MHGMRSIATDVSGACQSVSHAAALPEMRHVEFSAY